MYQDLLGSMRRCRSDAEVADRARECFCPCVSCNRSLTLYVILLLDMLCCGFEIRRTGRSQLDPIHDGVVVKGHVYECHGCTWSCSYSQPDSAPPQPPECHQAIANCWCDPITRMPAWQSPSAALSAADCANQPFSTQSTLQLHHVLCQLLEVLVAVQARISCCRHCCTVHATLHILLPSSSLHQVCQLALTHTQKGRGLAGGHQRVALRQQQQHLPARLLNECINKRPHLSRQRHHTAPLSWL